MFNGTLAPARVSFFTIGCRVNQAETAALRNIFQARGYRIVDSDEAADIAVVNTCTVTHKSDMDTRRAVARLRRLNPRVRIALIGCQAQLQAEALAGLDNVAWVVGNARKSDLADIIEGASNGESAFVAVPALGRQAGFRSAVPAVDPGHTRANLKIQDGCDFFCSFCEIPFARGRARSRDVEDIICEARALVDAGHQEIVLTGINIGTYQDQGRSVIDVVRALEGIKGIERIRISSVEPLAIPEGLIDLMAGSEKLCRHLHLPFQHADNEILTRMRRRYTFEACADFVHAARAAVGDLCIGTDVIVGFPGEEAHHFETMYERLRDLPLAYFHVFSYSDRPHARSRGFDGHVDPNVIRERSARLRQLGYRKRAQFYRGLVGQEARVLFEQKKDGYWSGVTDHFVQVRTLSEKPLKNQIRTVRLVAADHGFLRGEIV